MAKKYSTDVRHEYFFEEGCHIVEILNDPLVPEISIARARLPVGGKTRLHVLDGTSETYQILSGRGKATIGKEHFYLEKGDSLYIPAGVSQCIENTGEEDLLFHCICHPRFKPKNYKDIEDQVHE